jgi:hypothetical protein
MNKDNIREQLELAPEVIPPLHKLFTAIWCSGCRTVKAYIDRGYQPVEVVDYDEHTELAKELGLKSLPTLVTTDGDLIVGAPAIINFLNKQRGN